MFERRSLGLPITLAVVMFVLLLALTVGWVLLNVFGMLTDERRAGLYVALLSIGATLLTFVIVGTALYLTLTIKAINLSQRQSNFIDSVTHELKSPIASLKLYLQTLNRRNIPPADREVFIKSMLEDVERLDQLINHLLDAARLEKDRVGMPPDDVRLDEIIRYCTAGVCLRHGVPLEVVRLDLAPCVVRAAKVDLELVFRNLLDNAVKYADDHNPKVDVTLRAEGTGRVVAQISDNGCGIPQRLKGRIFGRFVRLGSELERDKPGTGLGLYIVRTLVKRLKGTINVRDREGQQGATFEVQLPGSPIELDCQPAEAESNAHPASPAGA